MTITCRCDNLPMCQQCGMYVCYVHHERACPHKRKTERTHTGRGTAFPNDIAERSAASFAFWWNGDDPQASELRKLVEEQRQNPEATGELGWAEYLETTMARIYNTAYERAYMDGFEDGEEFQAGRVGLLLEDTKKASRAIERLVAKNEFLWDQLLKEDD